MGLFASISGGQSYVSFQEQLQEAIDDPDVKSIILAVDSPGGSVDGAQAAAEAVFAARDMKPICSYVDGQMCSAAYWIGAAASKTYIGSDTDVVGSIGVVAQHVDTSAAEYMRGIKVTDITAGKYKRITSQHQSLTPEGRGVIQDQIDHIYSVFVDSVARNRGTDAQTVLSNMADGRVFVGQKAIDAGLVDGKMTLSQLMKQMQSQGSVAKSGGAMSQTANQQRGSKPMAEETTYTVAQMESAKKEAHDAAFAAGVAQGRTEGATAERERIQAVEKALLPGHEKLIADFKFDGKTTGAEAALQVVQAENTLRGEELKKLRASAPNPVPESAGSAASDAEASKDAGAKKEVDPEALAAKATDLVAQAKKDGKVISFAAAVAQLTAK
jgi:capsid assembly protease